MSALAGFDPERAFSDQVRRLMERDRDPAVHSACWDYLEGRIDRRSLRRRPEYQRAIAGFYRERFAEAEEAGVDLKALRARVRAAVVAQDEAEGTDLAGSILTPEGE